MIEFPAPHIKPSSAYPWPAARPHGENSGEPRANSLEEFRSRSDSQETTSNTANLVESLVRSHEAWLRKNVQRAAAIHGLDSDDLAQEVMVSLLHRNATVEIDNPGIRSWLARRVNWTARDVARRNRRELCNPISRDDFLTAAEGSTNWISSAPVETVAPITDQNLSKITIQDLTSLGLTLAEATAALLICFGADFLNERVLEPPRLDDDTNCANKSRALTKLTTDTLEKLRSTLGLSDEETAIFIAWRRHGSTRTASAHLGLTEVEVEKIIAKVHKKIYYVFHAGAFPIGPFGAGPWLVVYDNEPGSEDISFQVRVQCISRGIDCARRPIGEIRQTRIDSFVGLIAVLPSRLKTVPATTLQPFKNLIMKYRAHRPDGLDSILRGSCKWSDAGVVQIVGRCAIMRHLDAEMETAVARICARHDTDSSRPPDVFWPYTHRCVLTLRLGVATRSGIPDDTLEIPWREIRAWGVTDPQDVPKLLKHIDNFRNHYENKRFSQLYRPVCNLERNRLDIILDGPHDIVVGDRKTWMENGARVCREVLKELRKVVPEITRPGGHGHTKDAQKQLYRLYLNLRIMSGRLNNQDPDKVGD